jgi:hypothetical protein
MSETMFHTHIEPQAKLQSCNGTPTVLFIRYRGGSLLATGWEDFKSLVTLKTETICSFDTSVPTTVTLYKAPKDIPLILRGFQSATNYTDFANATGRRILGPTFLDRGVSRGQRGGTPTDVNLSFLDRSRYVFLQAAPHYYSRG